MEPERVVTPGGYRPRGIVHKIDPGHALRILTGRLQGLDASGAVTADYGSIPRDGGNPAWTPGDFPATTSDGSAESDAAPRFGHGWAAYAHWSNEISNPVSAFRATWTVPPEPMTRSGQTIFLFIGMQDSIPMSLVTALQWGPSAAGGGDFWSVGNWYIGGTTGAVFHGDLVRVSAGDAMTGVISLGERRREFCDYRGEFQGVPGANLTILNARPLTRCGVVLAAFGVRQCGDYPAATATRFRGIEIQRGDVRPDLSWTLVNAISDCGQQVLAGNDANPGGQIDVRFRAPEAEPVPAPVVEAATPAEPAAAAETAAVATGADPSQNREIPAAHDAMQEERPVPPPAPAPASDAPPAAESLVAMAPAVMAAEAAAAAGRLVEITIHNHGSGGAAPAAIEGRLAALEAAVSGLVRAMDLGWRSEAAATGGGDLAAQIERLARLRESSALTDAEFSTLKSRLLDRQGPEQEAPQDVAERTAR